MKKFLAFFAVLAAAGTVSYAQCDKKVILTSTKTEYLSADSTMQRSVDENSEVVFDKNSIVVKPGNEDHTMTGTINSYTCNWTTPYKEGKLVLKTAFTDGNETKNVTITIAAKAGKINFTAVVEGEDKIIRLVVDKFEEKTN